MLRRPWYSVWPEGVPKSIEYPEAPVYYLLLESAKSRPSACAIVQAESGTCYTYEALVDVAKSIAAWLQGRGAGRGVQVLFSAFNTVEAVAGLFGVWLSGAEAVMVDPLTTSEDLRFQLEGRDMELAVVSPEFYSRESSVLSEAGVEDVLVLGYMEPTRATEAPRVYGLNEALAQSRGWREESVKPREDVSTVFYYSGIAGRTMQTLHTHYGAVSSTIAYTEMLRLGEPIRSLVVAPITHILGLQAGLLVSLYSGGAAVLMRRWNSPLALNAMIKWGVNYLPGAPMMHEALLKEIRDRGLRPSLKLGVSGGAPLKPETQEEYQRVTGAPLVQIYGMTETWVLTFQPTNLSHVKGTVGIPLPDVDVRIVDPENPTRELGVGEAGELLVKAPWIMKGYEDEGETRAVFVDGWLRTGDLLAMDENGLLYFRGVRKRMIKYKAYPIFPRDLEIILEKHPAVRKALVEGEPHPEYGQIPVAKVVLEEEYRGKVTPDEIMEYVNSRVAFYKKIRRVEIVDKL